MTEQRTIFMRTIESTTQLRFVREIELVERVEPCG